MSKHESNVRQSPGSSVLWAWWDVKAQEYRHIYPSELVVRICSPDGFKRAEEAGEGKVVQVLVTLKEESEMEVSND